MMTNYVAYVDRDQALGWLKPTLDEFGIDVNVVMEVTFAPDHIAITCAYTPAPSDDPGVTPPSLSVEGQNPMGLDKFSRLEYRIEIGIVDAATQDVVSR